MSIINNLIKPHLNRVSLITLFISTLLITLSVYSDASASLLW